jgi:hypothetical protein
MSSIIICFIIIARNAQTSDLDGMTFDEFLGRASEECHDWLGINSDIYCPCFKEQLKTTAREREKQLYIVNWKLLDENVDE